MKKEKKRSFRGTVLFTTVSVMALLIIFLMGTLVLASASNSRAHKSYATSQASYTARAAVDSFIRAMSDKPEIAAAVEGLADGGNFEVELSFNRAGAADRSLGVIGYIDDTGAFNEGKILVQDMNEKSYMYKNDLSGSGAQWHETRNIRVTATVEVGSERETVSAIIRKRPGKQEANPPSVPQVKGLQSMSSVELPAGELITGGLGVGLEASELKDYELRNKQTLETTLTFINGNLEWKTSEAMYKVYDPVNEEKPTLPYSQFVVAGNFHYPNNANQSFIEVDYTPIPSWTVKEIPYLFVNGAMTFGSSAQNFITGNGAPFNVIVGTLDSKNQANPTMDSANLFLMDERSDDTYETKAGPVIKGNNVLGNTQDTSLKQWTTSLISGTEVPKFNYGGNIYCNGDLTLKGVKVEGSVYVRGNLTVDGNDSTVNGDIVVGGNYNDDNNKMTCGGTIYSANSNGDLVRAEADVQAVNNIEVSVPDNAQRVDIRNDNNRIFYYKWHTADHKNDNGVSVDPWGNELPDELQDTDLYYEWNSTYVQGESFSKDYLEMPVTDLNAPEFQALRSYLVDPKDDAGNRWYRTADLRTTDAYSESNEYYYGVPKNIGSAENPNWVPTSEHATADTYCYYVDDSTGISYHCTADEYDSLRTNMEKQYTRADLEGNDTGIPVGANPVTYWRTNDDQPFNTEEEARNYMVPNGGAGARVNIAVLYPSQTDRDEKIYPISMRRENIYQDADGNDAADGFITTLREAREGLGLDPETGVADEKRYPVYTAEQIAKLNLTEYKGDKIPDTITEDCIISGQVNRTIHIKPSTDSQNPRKIVIRGLYLNDQGGGLGKLVFDRTSGEQLDIILDGTSGGIGGVDERIANATLVVEKGMIEPSDAMDGNAYKVIKHSDDWGINYYGTENSSIVVRNSGTLFGSFKTPKTEISANVEGSITVDYIDEYNKTHNGMKPVIVGNALFGKFYAQNKFGLTYTASGSGAGSGNPTPTFKTAVGWYEISYMTGS
jgi:hypothetical protein